MQFEPVALAERTLELFDPCWTAELPAQAFLRCKVIFFAEPPVVAYGKCCRYCVHIAVVGVGLDYQSALAAEQLSFEECAGYIVFPLFESGLFKLVYEVGYGALDRYSLEAKMILC